MNKKIEWCLRQKKGIELIEPNENLCGAYLKEADETLSTMEKIEGRWKVITAYYACYHSLYAILMKAGVKCEIHDCTLELMDLFDFSSEEIDFLKKLKKKRVDVQYYLKDIFVLNIEKVKSFVIHCRIISKNLDEDAVRKIRGLVKND